MNDLQVLTIMNEKFSNVYDLIKSSLLGLKMTVRNQPRSQGFSFRR